MPEHSDARALQLHLVLKDDSILLLSFAGGIDVCRGMVWVAS